MKATSILFSGLIALIALAPVSASAQTLTRDLPPEPSGLSSNHFVRGLEITANVVTAYHVLSLPHEAVHGVVGMAFGIRPEALHVQLMKESISFHDGDEARANATAITFTSLSAPAFTRSTLNLPRWIVQPVPGSYWDAWTGTHWSIGYMTTWITTVGSWISWSKQENVGWDFYNAAQAMGGRDRTKQAMVLGGLTALMAADLYLNLDEIRENFAVMYGMRPADQRRFTKQSPVGEWQFAWTGLGVAGQMRF